MLDLGGFGLEFCMGLKLLHKGLQLQHEDLHIIQVKTVRKRLFSAASRASVLTTETLVDSRAGFKPN
jgi:hypothetical protein